MKIKLKIVMDTMMISYSEFRGRTRILIMQKKKKKEREKKGREKGLSKAVLSINIFEKLNFFN